MKIFLLFFVLISIMTSIQSYKTMQPVWSSGYDMQCNSAQVYNSGAAGTFNNATFSLQTSFQYAYTSPPKVVISICGYEADNDLTYNQYYAYYNANTATTTSIIIDVKSIMPAFRMNVRYLAINYDFPYHINVYSNCFAYGGPSSVTTNTFSISYINYTQQALAQRFNTFTPISPGDYGNSKVLLFISCLIYRGAVQTPPFVYPPELSVISYAYNSSHYAVQFTVGQNVTITASKIHFNMLMFDVENIESEGLNKLIYARANYSDISGGFMPVPKQYWNATFYGFTDFSSESTKNYLIFQLFLGTLSNNNEGIIMLPPKHPNNPLKTPLQRYGITLFYMQSLICTESNFYLNPKLKKCYELIVEPDGCNEGLTIRIPYSNYTKADLKFLNLADTGIQLKSITPDGKDSIIRFQYTKQITDFVFQIRFPTRQIVYVKGDPFLPLIHYTQTQCQTYYAFDKLAFAYVIIGYIVLLFSLFSAKIVGLELFGVLQLCYFTLISHDSLNLYLSPLAKFRLLNGLNLQLIPQVVSLPSSIRYLKISSNFLNNCNIMLFIFFIFLIIALILYAASIFCIFPKIHQLCLRLLKQGVITFIMFNSFNISFSAGLHWKLADFFNDRYYALGSLLIIITFVIIFIFVISMGLTEKNGFGEFKDKFKSNWVSQLFIPFQIILRIVLGIYCSSTSEIADSTMIALGFSIFFFLYVAVNLPFIQHYHNYRTCLIHFTSVFILLVTNFYRTMKMNTPLTIKAYIFTPAIIELMLIGVCIITSVVVLAYEFYLYFRGYHHNTKSKQISILTHYDGSHVNINETLSNLEGK